jgi:hypothetical protein
MSGLLVVVNEFKQPFGSALGLLRSRPQSVLDYGLGRT